MIEVLICVNRSLRGDLPSCAARGSEAIADAVEQGIKERNLDVSVERIRCFGQCSKGPNIRILGEAFRHHVTEADIPDVLDWIEAACIGPKLGSGGLDRAT